MARLQTSLSFQNASVVDKDVGPLEMHDPVPNSLGNSIETAGLSMPWNFDKSLLLVQREEPVKTSEISNLNASDTNLRSYKKSTDGQNGRLYIIRSALFQTR